MWGPDPGLLNLIGFSFLASPYRDFFLSFSLSLNIFTKVTILFDFNINQSENNSSTKVAIKFEYTHSILTFWSPYVFNDKIYFACDQFDKLNTKSDKLSNNKKKPETDKAIYSIWIKSIEYSDTPISLLSTNLLVIFSGTTNIHIPTIKGSTFGKITDEGLLQHFAGKGK